MAKVLARAPSPLARLKTGLPDQPSAPRPRCGKKENRPGLQGGFTGLVGLGDRLGAPREGLKLWSFSPASPPQWFFSHLPVLNQLAELLPIFAGKRFMVAGAAGSKFMAVSHNSGLGIKTG